MLGVLSKYIKDVSVLRKLLFTVYLMIFLIDGILLFSLPIPHMEFLAFLLILPRCFLKIFSLSMLRHLCVMKIYTKNSKIFPETNLGVVLSSRDTCVMCHSRLLVRKDRPASIVIYDDRMGTVHGTHFHKYCTNRACGHIHYYGYYTSGKASQCSKVIFEDDWESLRYFVSSRKTTFSLTVFFLKIWHGNNNIALASPNF